MSQNKQGGGGNIIPWLPGGLLRINELMSVKLSSKAEVKKWKASRIIATVTYKEMKTSHLGTQSSFLVMWPSCAGVNQSLFPSGPPCPPPTTYDHVQQMMLAGKQEF